MEIVYALKLLFILATTHSTHSFLLSTDKIRSQFCRVNSHSSIFAKKVANKAKNKKKAVNSASGGFGKHASESTKVSKLSDDYSIFPALEPTVSQTLLRAPSALLEPGVLSLEVYDRLEQIYGFPNFNYDGSGPSSDSSSTSAGEEVSFMDMISVNDEPSKTLPSRMFDTDFSDLLTSATGAETSSLSFDSMDVQGSQHESFATGVAPTIAELSNLPQFTEFRVLHMDPLILAIDDFFTDEECDRYIAMSENADQKSREKMSPMQIRSRTVGKDAQAKAQRTSTTWFHHYTKVPELMSKASRLLGLDSIDRWEEPQTVRYQRNEKFTWHLDALSPDESTPEKGGQRTATLLVYLTAMNEEDGGATIFRDLAETQNSGKLRVQPKKGSALLFFPSAGGIPNSPMDIRTLHCGEVVNVESSQDKWISQLWLRESAYTPTGPPGNSHHAATDAITEFCEK